MPTPQPTRSLPPHPDQLGFLAYLYPNEDPSEESLSFVGDGVENPIG